MFNVAICDDEIYQLTETHNLISHIFNNNNIKVDILKFNSSTEFLNFLYENENYFDFIFLDIVMDDLNGVDLAKVIRKSDSLVNIIFTTTSKEYVLDGYDVSATSYLLKPLDPKKTEQVILDTVSNISQKSNKVFCAKVNQNIYKINLKDILYLESSLRKIIIHKVNNDSFVFHDKLDKIEQELNTDSFVRCHKSYLVNLYYVKEIENSKLILQNNDKIPISRPLLKITKDTFIDYFSKRD